jgi:Pyruvate/2-oxoacid:ferredoxin oxidoreductase delta subunit
MLWLWIPLGVIGVLVAVLAVLWIVGERGHILGLPSTRAAIKGTGNAPKRAPGLKAVHGYIYGRWANEYIGFSIHTLLPNMWPAFKQWWADRYHGKVLTTELARAIITLDHDIARCDLEQIIPYPTARNIVLEGPPQIVIYECPCRAARENPCQPTQVCMIVGDGSFVLDHHPETSRRITQQEALDLLQGEHERGHVHVAYFKDACNDQFYAICNCCKCCCGGIEAMRHSVSMVASSGFVARVNEEACIGCGDCAEACPFDAITAGYTASVSWEQCMGCGVCVDTCANAAMSLVADARKGIPLDVRKIGVQPPAN